MVMLFIFILLLLLFILLQKFEPRTIFLGLLLILLVVATPISLSLLGFDGLAIILGLIISGLFVTPSVIVAVAFFLKHIQAYLHLWKWLLVITSIGLIMFLSIDILSLLTIPFIRWLIGYLICGVIYMMCLLNAYLLSSWLYLQTSPKQEPDYLVVLGAGLLQDKVTPLLAKRIDKAIEIHQSAPHSIIIMSGGQGPDEIIPEGKAMANYAIRAGISKKKLLIEDQSINTEENILYSTRLMHSQSASFAVVSTNYHIFRASIIARKLGLKSIGFGAKSGKDWIFNANALLREFFAYLYLNINWTILTSIGFTILYAYSYHVLLIK